MTSKCPIKNCDGYIVNLGNGNWKCSKTGWLHYYTWRSIAIRAAQRMYYSQPLEKFSSIERYWEHLRRHVDRSGIKPIPQERLL